MFAHTYMSDVGEPEKPKRMASRCRSSQRFPTRGTKLHMQTEEHALQFYLLFASEEYCGSSGWAWRCPQVPKKPFDHSGSVWMELKQSLGVSSRDRTQRSGGNNSRAASALQNPQPAPAATQPGLGTEPKLFHQTECYWCKTTSIHRGLFRKHSMISWLAM